MTLAVHTQFSIDTILTDLQSLKPQELSNASLSPIVDQLMSLENKNLTTENVRTLHQIGQSLMEACSGTSSPEERFANLASYILTHRRLPDKRGLLGLQLMRGGSFFGNV